MSELWHHPELARQRDGGQAVEVSEVRAAVRHDGGRRELQSTLAGPADADWLSNVELETRPPTPEDLPVSLGDHDLRETFELPLMSGRDAERSGAAPDPAFGDAASLLDDPGPRRKVTAADARSRARRCSCGGYVPQGMSVCMTCGLDQETGLRVGLEDDLAPPPPPRPSGASLACLIMGGLCATAALVSLIKSLMASGGGAEGVQKYGWFCLALVSAFAILASVQFIRGKSAKLLMLALTLGVVVDVLGLVAIPLVQANIGDSQDYVKPVKQEDPDDPDFHIKPHEERIE